MILVIKCTKDCSVPAIWSDERLLGLSVLNIEGALVARKVMFWDVHWTGKIRSFRTLFSTPPSVSESPDRGLLWNLSKKLSLGNCLHCFTQLDNKCYRANSQPDSPAQHVFWTRPKPHPNHTQTTPLAPPTPRAPHCFIYWPLEVVVECLWQFGSGGIQQSFNTFFFHNPICIVCNVLSR